jgi:cytochrome P450
MDSGDRMSGSLPFPGPTADFLANPYPAYQRLRAETPILAHGGNVFLTRYKDIAAILRDERFGRARQAPQAAAETPAAYWPSRAAARHRS